MCEGGISGHICTNLFHNPASFKTGPFHNMINLIGHHFVEYEFIIFECVFMHLYMHIQCATLMLNRDECFKAQSSISAIVLDRLV